MGTDPKVGVPECSGGLVPRRRLIALLALGYARGEARGRLELVRRQTLLGNRGAYGSADEQLHFPYLHESSNGTWYLTYREGPHLDRLFGRGNRVQCVQSRDQGQTWVPWLGLDNHPRQYQLFVARMTDGTLWSWRLDFEEVRQARDGTLEASAVVLRSRDEGATWNEERARVSGLPYPLERVLLSFWGAALTMSDGRVLCGVIHRRLARSAAGVVESNDGGRSFRYLASVCPDPGVPVVREPGLARLASGDLLCVVRTALEPDAPMLQTRSRDGGRTWSAPRRLGFPGASPQLLLLDNGVLVLSFGTRRILQVMASWHGTGEVWSPPLVLYEGQTSGYSHVQALGPDRFRVVYQEGTFDAYQPGGHRLVRVELRAGPGGDPRRPSRGPVLLPPQCWFQLGFGVLQTIRAA